MTIDVRAKHPRSREGGAVPSERGLATEITAIPSKRARCREPLLRCEAEPEMPSWLDERIRSWVKPEKLAAYGSPLDFILFAPMPGRELGGGIGRTWAVGTRVEGEKWIATPPGLTPESEENLEAFSELFAVACEIVPSAGRVKITFTDALPEVGGEEQREHDKKGDRL